MKEFLGKTVTFLLAFLLIIPLLSFQNADTANAKTKKVTNEEPVISEESKTLEGYGESFELSLNILRENISDIYWYTLNDKIAKVKNTEDSDKAIVTSVSKGTTYVNCKITYRNGTTWKGSCKITVKAESHDDDDYDYEDQAELVSLVRTEKNRLLATFDREIQTPGLVLVNNKSECIEGKKDSSDKTKVYYQLSTQASSLTGKQKVYIGYWEAYDVSPDDTSSDRFKEVTVNFTDADYTALPAPYAIEQSDTDRSILYIRFQNKLDEGTAENEENYTVKGATVKDADLTSNSSKGATVKLVLKSGTIKTTGNYVVTVSGIKGYNNNYTTMKSHQVSIRLTENVPPTLTSFYYTYPATVVLTFNETITGTVNFKVIQEDEDILSYEIIKGNQIILYLSETPELGETLQIIPKEDNSIKDLSGNLTTSILTRNLVPYQN